MTQSRHMTKQRQILHDIGNLVMDKIVVAVRMVVTNSIVQCHLLQKYGHIALNCYHRFDQFYFSHNLSFY